MEAVDRPICILRSHFVSEVHRMQIPPHATHSPPRRLAMQIIDINDKKGDKIFNKIHGKSVVYRLSPILRKDREEDIVLYINVHREISAFFTIMDHFSNAFDISSLHR